MITYSLSSLVVQLMKLLTILPCNKRACLDTLFLIAWTLGLATLGAVKAYGSIYLLINDSRITSLIVNYSFTVVPTLTSISLMMTPGVQVVVLVLLIEPSEWRKAKDMLKSP